MKTIQQPNDDVIQLLCGRLLDLVIETETFKMLVCDMAAGIPAEAMAADVRELLFTTIGAWGKR